MEAPTCAMVEIFPMILIRAGGLPFATWQSLVSSSSWDTEAESVAIAAAQMVQDSFDQVLTTLPDSDFRTDIYNARKAFFQKQKMPSGPLMVSLEARRSAPRLEGLLENLLHWNEAMQWTQRFEIEYLERLESEWKSIQQAANETVFQRTLLFASHDLSHRLPVFCEKPVAAFDKKDRKTALTVFQYLCRSIFKTAPLGRFTTVQLWRLGHEQLQGFDTEKIAITPSVAMLPALYEVLLRSPAFYQSLDVVLNPCIPADYSNTPTLSWLYFDGEQEAFQRLESNPVVELVVRVLLDNQRKMSWSKLQLRLSSEVSASPEQLQSLLQELIDLGLLEWQLPEKGLTPSWCTNLCNYLSYLPTATVLTEAAFLLQLLRVSARAIPFQSVQEAEKTQREAKAHLEAFLLRHNGVVPPIPAEQIFFEDVERTVPNNCPEVALRQFAAELKQCWGRSDFQALPAFRSRLFHFTEQHLEMGQVIDFQEYCERFFASKIPAQPALGRAYDGKIGAMIQVYQEEGVYHAVVNAMFPGGGKLFSRWMHLFPSDFRESVEACNDPETIFFPWQGWSNANFQSISSNTVLEVPDGRVGQGAGKKALLLSDLGVRRSADGPELIDKTSLKIVRLTDLGLESPESRPPVLQVLWHLGVPFVSSLALSQADNPWASMNDLVKKRARMVYESLVLSRAAWELQPEFFHPKVPGSGKPAMRFLAIKKDLESLGIPRYFFARLNEQREKPQFFDRESPVSMLVFEKMLVDMPPKGIHIEEMLPIPSDWVLGASEKYAGEFVLEFE